MSDEATIVLAESLNIQHAAALFDELNQNTDKKSVTLQADQVKQVDTSAIQLLFTFEQALKKQNASLCWSSPSTELKKAFELVGLPDYFKGEDNG
ncbi:STAS domain-containing protein [Piscirickettsia litoralis]|uniref:STAS domain-containing protein n=1 Tax=Piscirickettsia litoralis TaxID=1891921 RepID=A0ABX3A020_9GAMM|nr:STAS domain-containing protein [Piscirickettsia litoralis]ODN42118.1 hypothetical protein BGC07_03100 [Piscirickettsia litoralis]